MVMIMVADVESDHDGISKDDDDQYSDDYGNGDKYDDNNDLKFLSYDRTNNKRAFNKWVLLYLDRGDVYACCRGKAVGYGSWVVVEEV